MQDGSDNGWFLCFEVASIKWLLAAGARMTVFLLYRGKNLHCERSLSLENKLFRFQFAALDGSSSTMPVHNLCSIFDAVSGIVTFV
jgi:hypothetical protein